MRFRINNKMQYLIGVALAALLTGTLYAQGQGAGNDPAHWSSMYPLSIPLDIRQAEFNKGNIVPNPSFEEGTVTDKRMPRRNFEIANWNKVGENVEWVDTRDPYYNVSEAHAGNHAIKIVRAAKDVHEVDNRSEGIESDFIKVIPGNYTFFFDVKLENVFPAVERYEVKISKNIDVHLTFYDKDKKEISPAVYYHRFGKEVDNSFKGYAFSNFFYIDKFEWGKVLGRTYNNNFSEGDMPDGCAYIKIFFGLKGRGTMYVDNVDFRFSRWNFTSLERMMPLFKQEYHPSQLVVPTPKMVSDATEIPFAGRDVVLVSPNDREASSPAAVDLLKEKLLKIAGVNKKRVMLSDGNYKENGKGKLIFSIGKTALYRQHESRLGLERIAGEDQGYVVRKIDTYQGNTIIFLSGNTPVGDYYAATTAVQLLDQKKPVYYHAEIADYPDFKGRSYRLKTYDNVWTIERDTTLSRAQKDAKIAQLKKDAAFTISSVSRFSFYKLNKIYNDYWSHSKKWWDPGELFFDMFEGLGRECKQLGVISTALQINPYFHFDFESEEDTLSDSLRNLFVHSDPNSIQKIKNIIQKCAESGTKTVMLCADDFVPHSGKARGEYALFNDRDKKAFFNMAHAQVTMLNELKAWMDKNYPGMRFEFVPAPYLNEFVDYGRGTAEAFFRDLTSHVSKDIAIIWTGNTVRSLVYDQADLKRYTDLIKKKPMLWDNTPYARDIAFPNYYPGKTVMCNLFEPYDIIVPKDFYKVMDTDIYLNGNDFEERYNIKFATFADFTWNNNDYRPDFSLYKVLVGNFGKEGALKLLKFNDHLYRFVSKYVEIKVGMERASKEKPYVIKESDKSEAAVLRKLTDESFKDLEKSITNTRLLSQTKDQVKGYMNAYDKILQNKDGYLVGEYFLQR